MPQFIRFALWVGPRKRAFLIAFGCGFALLMLLVMATLLGVATYSMGFWISVAVVSFACGIFAGWFMWQLFIWPTLAFYPRNTEAPHQTHGDAS